MMLFRFPGRMSSSLNSDVQLEILIERSSQFRIGMVQLEIFSTPLPPAVDPSPEVSTVGVHMLKPRSWFLGLFIAL